jgi:hypothetical protein
MAPSPLLLPFPLSSTPLLPQCLLQIQQLEPTLKETAVFATNTSALPIGDVAKAAKRPENVVGMHYFSPVDKMPLLEVITHAGTSKEVCSRAWGVLCARVCGGLLRRPACCQLVLCVGRA